MMYRILPYLGGKTYGARQLARFFPRELDVLASPFFGMGSLELYLGHTRRCRIIGADGFWPVVNLWNCFLNARQGFLEALSGLRGYDWPGIRETALDLVEREVTQGGVEDAAKFAMVLAVERISCVRRIATWHMGELQPPKGAVRWKRYCNNLVTRLRRWHVPPGGLTMEHLDCFDFFDKYEDEFLYLDPPYVGMDYYGFRSEHSEDFDHARLAEVLRGRDNWVLSYQEHPLVRELYKGCMIDTLRWVQGSTGDRKMSNVELVIRPASAPSLSDLQAMEIIKRQRAIDKKNKGLKLKLDFF